MTGVPSAQRTVAFEKACVLFNLGALHTQIGTRLERGTGDGLDGSVDNFLRAAAVFRFIFDKNRRKKLVKNVNFLFFIR